MKKKKLKIPKLEEGAIYNGKIILSLKTVRGKNPTKRNPVYVVMGGIVRKITEPMTLIKFNINYENITKN